MSRVVALFTTVMLVAAAVAPATAQRTSGNISGEGKAGDVVRVERQEIGFVRELRLEADGKYRIPRVPTGIYVVTVTQADGSVRQPQQVRVQIGTTSRVK